MCVCAVGSEVISSVFVLLLVCCVLGFVPLRCLEAWFLVLCTVFPIVCVVCVCGALLVVSVCGVCMSVLGLIPSWCIEPFLVGLALGFGPLCEDFGCFVGFDCVCDVLFLERVCGGENGVCVVFV